MVKNKFEKTPNGWIELRMTEIIVNRVHGPCFGFEAWKQASESIGRAGFEHCCRCKKQYKPLEQIWLAFTDHGNKHICEDCAMDLTHGQTNNPKP